MICTNCFEEEYKTSKTDLAITVNGEKHLLRDLECEICPACGEITSIATGLGFTHLGRFSIAYREVFGESPSQTLRRGRAKLARRSTDS